MGDGKSESGYVLSYVLGMIIFIMLTVATLFFIASTAFLQINKVDQFKRIKEVEEYALEDGTKRIQKKIDTYLTNLNTVNLGDNLVIISREMDNLFKDFNISKKEVGSENQFSYTFKIEEIKKERITPYTQGENESDKGWIKDFSEDTETKAINAKLSFYVKVEVTERLGTGINKERQANGTYINEIQWNTINLIDDVSELDVWRSVVFASNSKALKYLSADEWLRTMDVIYKYDSNVSNFNMSEFEMVQGGSNPKNYTIGMYNSHVSDVSDGTEVLDFRKVGSWSGIPNVINSKGSFLLKNGIQVYGSGSNAQLVVSNLFYLGSKQFSSNIISGIGVIAQNGIYIDLNKFSSLANYTLNIYRNEINTSNLLINNTKGGVIVKESEINITPQNNTTDFSFSNYLASNKKEIPSNNRWNEFTKGNMTVSSSNLSLGQGASVKVSGNFMLTSAGIDNKGLPIYFENSILKSPSVLTLSGEDTVLEVKGKSFIDAPKNGRREILGENLSKETGVLGSSSDWNRITLKDGAKMKLDYTGIESFNLDVDVNSIFDIKLLPKLDFFDTSFLSNGIQDKKLNGKVILRVFSQEDAKVLQEKLKEKNIPSTIVINDEEAKNGRISIIQPSVSVGSGNSQIITRIFHYIEHIEY